MVNTLNIYERFKKADLPDKTAKELAQIFKETFDMQHTIPITEIGQEKRLSKIEGDTKVIK
ncbi:MAG: hypothetical protein HY754_04420 [Nitrospirae bacterium]|nr:hypothetical protein [Nitrospirota bacterium]